MKKKYLAILLALCLVLCFLPAVALADGATIYVDNAAEVAEPDGSATNPYATIGAAVAAANGGDIIIIQNGTYNENVTINKPLTLQGESEDGVIIQFDPATRANDVTFNGDKACLLYTSG